MNLTLIVAAVSAALAWSIGFGAAWTLQGRSIDAMKLEAANDRIAQQQSARKTAERLTNAIAEAQRGSANRIAAIRMDSDLSRSELERLRDQLRATGGGAAKDPATCPDTAATLGTVLTQCSNALQEMARNADGHVNDLLTCRAVVEQSNAR